MPNYLLRWANRSDSNQDWMISNGDQFTLLPDHVREVQITINNNYTFQIAVSTNGGFAAANLSYTAAGQVWALATATPNEWELAQGAGIVTVRCLLEDVNEEDEEVEPQYLAPVANIAESRDVRDRGGYPAYQLYEDNTGTTYCSRKKMKSHDEGKEWVRDCLDAHPGTSCNGKPWLSHRQSGEIWPD